MFTYSFHSKRHMCICAHIQAEDRIHFNQLIAGIFFFFSFTVASPSKSSIAQYTVIKIKDREKEGTNHNDNGSNTKMHRIHIYGFLYQALTHAIETNERKYTIFFIWLPSNDD